ncbi:MAG: nucleobase:cation symporter-2 family protein [Rhodospirillales bacterium]|nr:nucleobase:cation symporter-2 family protein [Rhodospirillales bacterium]
MSATTAPVDELLPAPRLAVLGLQHVLVMYAGAVAVPLIVGGALGLPPDQRALLISADLFACGLATLVQSLGFPGVGIRLPVMMGVTFASVAPMLAMIGAAKAAMGAGFQPADALLAIYGSVIAAGVFGILVAPFVSRMLPAFPPLVTGTVILVIGVSLMRIGINWAGGGLPTLTKVVDGVRMQGPNPAYGAPGNLLIALFVLLVILGIVRWGRGFVANIAVLLGTIAGAVVAALLGRMNFAPVAAAHWLAPITPFQFGVPSFQIVPILTMCLVMIVVMIESTGMFLAVGAMVGRPVDRPALTRGLRADGIGTILGGVFNTFPYTSFSQNVGLVGVTGIRSRYVTVAGGVILVVLGLIPKLGAIVAAVPVFVLGGAGVVMFGMVAATGIRILAQVDYTTRRHNLFIVAISLGFGMIPLIADNFFDALPHALKPLLDSGILLASIVAVALNAFFNGMAQQDAHAAAEAALASEP